MNHILDRTSLVLLSGHRTGSLGKTERNNFAIASTLLEEVMNSRNIPTLSVPFMYGTNQSKIISAISNSPIALDEIRETMKPFTDSSSQSDSRKAA